MKKAIAVSLAGLLIAGAALATAPHHNDPQRKHGIYYEPGVFHDGDPNTPDLPFVAYTALEGNDFLGLVSVGTLDLSDLSTAQFWEYADDSACSGNKRHVECVATEQVYSTGGALLATQVFGWTFTTVDADHLAFVSQDVGAPNGASSVMTPVEGARCFEILAKMRELVATAGVSPGLLLLDSLCN